MSESYTWSKLKEKAYQAAKQSHDLPGIGRGAAGLSSKGVVVLGSSISNPVNSLKLCAECSMITNMISKGGGLIKMMVIVDLQNNIVEPCGKCEVSLSEYTNPESLILTNQGESSLKP